MPLAARRRRAALPLTLLPPLALLPSGCDSSCSFEPVGCYKDQGSPRTLRWHLDGCPTADAFGPESPSPRPAPKCNPVSLCPSGPLPPDSHPTPLLLLSPRWLTG